MALSLSNVLGRRTLALVGVGAATALTSWLIYLRNRYLNLKQITQGKESDDKSKQQKASQATESPTKPSESLPNLKPEAVESSVATAASEDLQMESLSADTSFRPPEAANAVKRRHVTPIVEEEPVPITTADETVIDDSTASSRVLTARSDAYKSAQNHSVAAAAISETEIVDSDFEQEIKAAKVSASEAMPNSPSSVGDAADNLAPEFIASRLAAMSKSDCASVQLTDRDPLVLARCLASGSDLDTVRTMQLIGRLAQFQHHMDRLSRGGCLVAAICDAFRRTGRPGSTDSAAVEVRLQCLLNLINLSGVPSNQSAIADIASSVAATVSASPRLAQYALQLLANLALYEPCRPRLLPLLPGFIVELRLQLLDSTSPSSPSSDQQRRLRQCLTLLSNLTSEPGACRSALASAIDAANGGDLPVPSSAAQLILADATVRLAWVCFVGNMVRETDCLLAATGAGNTLADAFMASLPAMSKLAQKLRDKLRSADKSTEYGQKVAALAKELKSLLRTSKVKSK